MLRITVDDKEGEGRVAVGVLARLSREIETQLDATDWMAGSYRLELSSPGLNRVLGRERDFEAACGSQVKLRTKRPLDGQRRFAGVLTGFQEGVVQLRSEGRDIEIPFAEIDKANAVYEFSRDDFKHEAGDDTAK